MGKSKFVPDISTNQRAARWTHALKKERRNGPPAPSAEEVERVLSRAAADAVDYGAPDPDLDDDEEENKDPWAEYRPGGVPAATRRRQRRHRAGHASHKAGGQRRARVYGATRPTSVSFCD